jgi:phosphohistidine phosphatase
MNLYIVRHAIAVARGTPGYEDDSQRPLTNNGRKKMGKIVKGIRQLGSEFDTGLSSPYVRARDTAKILTREFKMKDQLAFSENLIPPGNFDQLVNEINEKYIVENLALVGHEPMLSGFISWLTTGNTDTRITLKKGGVCCLSTENLHQEHRATLEWLLTPAMMVDLSKK